MLTCRKAADLLLDFLENSLPPEANSAVSQHLESCRACGKFMESYKKTTLLCKQALHKKAPADVGERLMEFLRKETRAPAPSPPTRPAKGH